MGLDSRTELVPDLSVGRLRADACAEAHPRPGEILLVVEVAEATLRYDRQIKTPRYARAGVPECWIVALPERRIEVYGDPEESGYQETAIPSESDRVQSKVIPGLTVPAVDILPIA